MLDIKVKFVDLGEVKDGRHMGSIRGHVDVDGTSEELTMELCALISQFERRIPNVWLDAIERTMDKDFKFLDFSVMRDPK